MLTSAGSFCVKVVTVTALVAGVPPPQALRGVQVIVSLAVPAVTVMLAVFCPAVIAQPLPVGTDQS
jgi:hypothetical protein